MNPTRKSAPKSIRFTADRIRRAAALLALQKLRQQEETINGAIQFLDDFEQLAIDRKHLPPKAYECFERLHLSIGHSLLELKERRQKIEPYAF